MNDYEKKVDEYVDSHVEDEHFNRPWLKAHMKECFRDLAEDIRAEERERLAGVVEGIPWACSKCKKVECGMKAGFANHKEEHGMLPRWAVLEVLKTLSDSSECVKFPGTSGVVTVEQVGHENGHPVYKQSGIQEEEPSLGKKIELVKLSGELRHALNNPPQEETECCGVVYEGAPWGLVDKHCESCESPEKPCHKPRTEETATQHPELKSGSLEYDTEIWHLCKGVRRAGEMCNCDVCSPRTEVSQGEPDEIFVMPSHPDALLKLARRIKEKLPKDNPYFLVVPAEDVELP